MWYKDKNKVLAQCTTQDVINICRELGSDFREGKDCLVFNTSICHGGDSYKLYYYHEPNPNILDDKGRRFHCYTCGESYDLIELIMRGFGQKGKALSWKDALDYLADKISYSSSGDKPVITESSEFQDIAWLKRLAKLKEHQEMNVKYSLLNEHILELFCYIPIEEWLKEGISEETLQKYEIGYFGRDDAITIPHRFWKDDTLIGIRKRNLDPYMIENAGKYMPITVEGNVLAHSLGNNLYGLSNNINAIKQQRRIELFEAEKSVLLSDTYFGNESIAVATCGSNLTNEHCNIIRQLGVTEVMIAYDREYHDPNSFEAEAYKNKLLLLAAQLINWCDVYLIVDTGQRLDFKDSPIDKGIDTFIELREEKLKVTGEMVDYAKSQKQSLKKII